MSESAKTDAETLPWRKRRPVLSRVVLYVIGLALAIGGYLLIKDDEQKDEAARVAALDAEMDGFGLLLTSDPSGKLVLNVLDKKFADEGLPAFTRGRALRWRAMALRHRMKQASDDAARKQARAAAEAALTEAASLELAADERLALQFEWAELRLESRDTAGARAKLPADEALTSQAARLLWWLLEAQAQRLDGDAKDAADTAWLAVDGFNPDKGQLYVGGRTWTGLQVAVELAGFVSQAGGAEAALRAWRRLRLMGMGDFDTAVAVARGLQAGGADQEALAAWGRAKAMNGRLAAAEAKRDPILGELDRRHQKR